MKYIGIIGLVLLVIILFIIFLTPAFHKWNANRVNDIKQEYITQDATKRIADYEWFYSQYEAIKATKNKVKLLKGEPEQKSVQLILEGMIGEYNAKSKMWTREMWKPKDLPYQIGGEE